MQTHERSLSSTHLSEAVEPHFKPQLSQTLAFWRVTYLHWCPFSKVKSEDNSTYLGIVRMKLMHAVLAMSAT